MSFEEGDRVIFVPKHANGNYLHPDCEHGEITALGSGLVLFVKFDDGESDGCLANQIIREP